ncbi:hypothetical protein LNTAR_17048 [Lentisphaera araneosa HTCC2155]|uniref:Xylose isomerase-like TIM barrel domain-containing protein n=1 Tax=Lentisphaera araneosa HTCC2155 TaxID=313628 RepID=A6DF98_9BACT|nr:TIM barrel protein [Lentisphaera araneosa]EDM29478.1 hypothetical protein LNTAR_17048 [Lentisphaera araneosa HTCC2155]
MKFKFVRGLWGMAEHSLEANLKKIKEGGFDAIEVRASFEADERAEMKELLNKYELEFIGQQHSDLFRTTATVQDHIDYSKEQLDNHKELNAIFVNPHTGKDYFTLAENAKIIREINAYADAIDLKVVHEVHRGRFSFSINTTLEMMEEIPELRLNADFSHWCCVHESLLQNQQERLEKTMERCDYIHARVGHEQGPQINDPRCPHNKNAMEAHFTWWDHIVDLNKKRRVDNFYICPEFGPAGYMPTLPLSNEPITNLWDVNHHILELLQKRYKHF